MTATAAMNHKLLRVLTHMFVSGTSTHKVGEVAQTLMGVAPSASTVSRLNQTLTEQYEAWRERVLQAHSRVIYAGLGSISPFAMGRKRIQPSS